MRHGVRGRQAQRSDFGRDMIEHPPLLDHRAFGQPSRARGINDIGQLTRRGADGAVLGTRAGLHDVLEVEGAGTAFGRHFPQGLSQRRSKRRRGQGYATTTLLDHLAQSGSRMVWIQGQIGPSCFEDGQDGDQKGDAPLRQ